jgi:pimeloyl-ACP methyl ester carboxylesterase
VIELFEPLPGRLVSAGEIRMFATAAHRRLLAGAGHMVQIEQPEAFERVLDAFLGEHYPRRDQ